MTTLPAGRAGTGAGAAERKGDGARGAVGEGGERGADAAGVAREQLALAPEGERERKRDVRQRERASERWDGGGARRGGGQEGAGGGTACAR